MFLTVRTSASQVHSNPGGTRRSGLPISVRDALAAIPSKTASSMRSMTALLSGAPYPLDVAIDPTASTYDSLRLWASAAKKPPPSKCRKSAPRWLS
jgi:hypothetical protein